MDRLESLLKMAEDELTEYSTDARKIEKLRRKIGLSVPAAEQKKAKEALVASMQSSGGISQLIEQQRQTVALPFWGIAGLGLLVGISFSEPLGLIAAIAGTIAAYRIQKWGWQLQAKRLLLNTFADIEARINQ